MTRIDVSIVEGHAEYKHPSLPQDKPCQTWYRVVGDLQNSALPPLMLLHGGPGASHKYLTSPFDDYAVKHKTAVVYYDQIGCGKSTHYREKRLDVDFWTIELFISELDNLVKHLGISEKFDLYGHSWGAMLSGKYAASTAKYISGLNRVILASGPCSMADWTIGSGIMIAEQPEEAQEIIRRTQKSQKWEDPEYKAAVEEIYKLHVCRLPVWPDIFLQSMHELESDDTSYMTMQGPDELVVLGSLKCKPATVLLPNLDRHQIL
jgi:proline-specific peptidase